MKAFGVALLASVLFAASVPDKASADQVVHADVAKVLLNACMASAKSGQPVDTEEGSKYLVVDVPGQIFTPKEGGPPVRLAVGYKDIVRCVLAGPPEMKDSDFAKTIMTEARTWPGVRCKVDKKIGAETCALPADPRNGSGASSVSVQMSGDQLWIAVVWAGG